MRASIGAYEDKKTVLVHPDLHEAFMAVAVRAGRINNDALGKYLAGSADRIVAIQPGERVRFERQGTRQGAVIWALVEVPHNND
jgi:hypothetical protein